MSKISVIIPAYNAEQTIQETIESVQKQTFSDFEIIIINDGSTDGTLNIIEQIDDPRIKCFSYQNGGIATARNRGILQAKGDYIAFLDADDLWTEDKLELQLAALQNNPEAGVAYSWTYYYFSDRTNQVIVRSNPVNFTGKVYHQLLIKNFLNSGSNPLIRREAIESAAGFDSTCTPCEDWDFYLQLASSCLFTVVPKYQIFYRQSSNSASSKMQALETANWITIQKAYQAAPPQLQYFKSQTLAQSYLYFATQYLKQGDNIEAVNQAGEKFWMAIRLYPKCLLENHTLSLIKGLSITLLKGSSFSLIKGLMKQWIFIFLKPVNFGKS